MSELVLELKPQQFKNRQRFYNKLSVYIPKDLKGCIEDGGNISVTIYFWDCSTERNHQATSNRRHCSFE